MNANGGQRKMFHLFPKQAALDDRICAFGSYRRGRAVATAATSGELTDGSGQRAGARGVPSRRKAILPDPA